MQPPSNGFPFAQRSPARFPFCQDDYNPTGNELRLSVLTVSWTVDLRRPDPPGPFDETLK